MPLFKRRVVMAATVLLVAVAAQGTSAGASSCAQQGAASVKQLVKAANAHRLAATEQLFAPWAVLRVSKQQWRGRSAIGRWWRDQFTHQVRLTLKSSVQVKGNGANAVLQRTTRGGDCPKGCLEKGSWQFAGSKFASMTLVRLANPIRAGPKPPTAVPSPPRGTPQPGVTPTVPS